MHTCMECGIVVIDADVTGRMTCEKCGETLVPLEDAICGQLSMFKPSDQERAKSILDKLVADHVKAVADVRKAAEKMVQAQVVAEAAAKLVVDFWALADDRTGTLS